MLASGIEEAAKQRQNFIRLRQDFTTLLERLAQSGEAAHAAREATRQAAKRERKARQSAGIRRTERTGPAFNEAAFNARERKNLEAEIDARQEEVEHGSTDKEAA